MTQYCQKQSEHVKFFNTILGRVKKKLCQQIHVRKEKPKVTVTTQNTEHEKKCCCSTYNMLKGTELYGCSNSVMEGKMCFLITKSTLI